MIHADYSSVKGLMISELVTRFFKPRKGIVVGLRDRRNLGEANSRVQFARSRFRRASNVGMIDVLGEIACLTFRPLPTGEEPMR